MELDDLVEELTTEGAEGIGAAAGIGLMLMMLFGSILVPILEALIKSVC